MRHSILALILCISFVGCSRTQGFSLKKIISKHSHDSKWEVTPPKDLEKIQKSLDQTYTYLGSGNHCYAFLSSDGKYVLKFFKQKHMRTQSMLDYLPLPAKRLFYPMKKIERRTEEREESFTSYKIAYEKLREETGIEYLHLNKTQDLLPQITLIDQNGKKLKLNLDEMEFLLQKKATLAFKHLKTLFENEESLLRAIDSLLTLIAHRSEKGIYDKDLQFYKNFGFCEGRAMEVDVGEFKLDKEPKNTLDEVREVSLQIQDFIQQNAPELLPTVQKQIDITLDSVVMRGSFKKGLL